MKKMLIFCVFFMISPLAFGQATSKMIRSEKLGQERKIKIQLPRNYESEPTKKYPLLIVLDGDYLFEPMAGSADYFSYWDEIPECIVVGVNQRETRYQDVAYDDHLFLPFEESAQFFEFLGMELLPYLDTTFRTSKFVLIAGHDMSANFINYYLFKDKPLFHAYLNLSPDLAPEMPARLGQKLTEIKRPTWFYLATASDDVPQLRTSTLQLNEQLQNIKNENLNYIFDDFEGANHYTLVGRAFPKALEKIFKPYAPIGLKEYDEIIAARGSPYDYLTNKYDRIEKDFGIKVPIRKDDFMMIGKALEFSQNWDDLEKLGKLAKKVYPDHTLGTYYLARSLEEQGKMRKAMHMYRSAFGQNEVDFIKVQFMLDRAEAIKGDFGYE